MASLPGDSQTHFARRARANSRCWCLPRLTPLIMGSRISPPHSFLPNRPLGCVLSPTTKVSSNASCLVLRQPQHSQPGAILCSEYDVANKIIEIEHQLPFRLTWEHVRGHQDDSRRSGTSSPRWKNSTCELMRMLILTA